MKNIYVHNTHIDWRVVKLCILLSKRVIHIMPIICILLGHTYCEVLLFEQDLEKQWAI